MYMYEYQAKKVFREAGLPVPAGYLAAGPEEVRKAAAHLNRSAVVKAQVRAGGRGKAGLVRLADSPDATFQAAGDILGKVHHGEVVKMVLVEESLNIAHELYAGVILDLSKGQPVVLLSSQGGVNIEEVAEKAPEALIRLEINPLEPEIPMYRWLEAWRKVGLTGPQLIKASEISAKMLRLFFRADAFVVEINPLAVTGTGDVIAADAKLIVDDSSLYRHQEFYEYKDHSHHPLESEALQAGVSFVPLNEDGFIGIIAGGAGLSMATMDAIVEQGASPAVFIDLGGGISEAGMSESLKIMMKTPGINGIIINVFGGINNCEIMAKGIQRAWPDRIVNVPVVVKMRGHSQEEGWAILEEMGIPLIKYGTTDEAIKLLLEKVAS